MDTPITDEAQDRCRQCGLEFVDAETARKLEIRLSEAQRERDQLKARYTWVANELFACDYGDNERGIVGWRLFGWRDKSGESRIYGSSIDAAVDAQISGEAPK